MSRSSTLKAYYQQAVRVAEAKGVPVSAVRSSGAFQRAYRAGTVDSYVSRIEGVKSYWAETRKAAKAAGVEVSDLHGNQHRGTGVSSQRWSTDYKAARELGRSPSRSFAQVRKQPQVGYSRSKEARLSQWNDFAKRWKADHPELKTLNDAKADPRFKREFQRLKRAGERESAALRVGDTRKELNARLSVYRALLGLGWITKAQYEMYVAKLGLG